MKGSHLWLTMPIVMIGIITMGNALPDVASKEKFLVKLNDTDLKIDKDIPLATDPRVNKMLPEIPEGVAKNNNNSKTTRIPLAEDPRFNKMLPENHNHLELQDLGTKKPNATPSTAKPATDKDDYMPDDYYYDYQYDDEEDEEDDEDENDEENMTVKTTTDAIEKKIADKLKPTVPTEKKSDILKPIEPKKEVVKPTTTIKPTSAPVEPNNSSDDNVVYDEENLEEDTDDDEVNNNMPCPADCNCSKNMNGYYVASCNRLDATHKFGSDITDLEVTSVKPNYPIILGAGFFKTIGLVRVSSIKIVNSQIEYMHPNAFEGLTELYSVNLTNSGITIIHPDTFADNRKLRLLTLAGNDLHQMQQKAIPFTDYMLNAPSVEELDISQCKLTRLLPTAFTHLKNIVYINMADNQLRTLPLGIFDKVETLEELDLSSNMIEDLPKNIFNGTSLSILHMKYNEIQTKLDFVPAEMQKLDLSYNKITFVNNMMFQHLKGLTSLILKGNAIRKIHETAFYPLRELRHIDLSFNDLEQISSLIFIGNVELDVIRLNDNPRLKQLPLDGFESNLGTFNVYFFDASNCDLNDLGEKTFSSMPHLSTLNLSWNNIEIIGKGLFSYLSKLIELDLSNNLLTNINELTFLHNYNLKKLSLSGNPLQSLAVKTFMPTKLITELDLSDCDLTSIWADKSSIREVNLKNLKILNLANNDIEHIHPLDFETMKSLSILDLDNNKVHCDDDFRSVIRLLNKKKVRVSNLRHDRDNAELNDSVFIEEMKQERSWDDVAREICKRDAENFKGTKDIIDTAFDSDDDEDDEDEDEEADIDGGIVKSGADDVNESEDDSCEDCDDEEYDDGDDLKATTESGSKKDGKIIKGYEDEIDEITLERRPFIYYGQYKYLMPILIIVFGVLAILLLIGKIVSLMMRRRGERYRQALLASKNSIVYQKLSEDIYGPTTPKFNRYAPINQV